jgi:hypothetical protein
MQIFREEGKKEIISPWLSVSEAAEYCRMSERTFTRKRKILPCPVGNFGGPPKFFSSVLDVWLKKVYNGRK